MRLRQTATALSLGLAVLAASPLRAQDGPDCAPAPEPVLSMSFGSRYTDDSATRSEIDPKGDAEADDALRPVDDFLRDLTEAANSVLEDGTDKTAVADCVVSQIAVWANAHALTDLQSETSNLTIGSRIAGFSLIMLQVAPHSTRADDLLAIKSWLSGLMNAQMIFWEEKAPNGAGQGNLRAWAALAGSATSALVDDPAMRLWAAWSVSYILCKAEPDGSLPQEMSRGKFALKYQLHAIAPLVTTTLLLDRQGIALRSICDDALGRIVDFALGDLETGEKSKAISGKDQSFFDGTDELEGFHLAWLEAYLILEDSGDRDAAEALAKRFRPLNYSKLGGNQTLLWQALE